MFSAGHAVKISGLPYRQIDYILRCGFLRPGDEAAHGRGIVRRFSARDLLAMRVAKEFLAAGLSLRPFMHVLRFVQRGRGLPPLEQMTSCTLFAEGKKVILLDNGGGADLGSMPRSRPLGHIIDLGAAARDVHRGIEGLQRAAK